MVVTLQRAVVETKQPLALVVAVVVLQVQMVVLSMALGETVEPEFLHPLLVLQSPAQAVEAAVVRDQALPLG